MKTVKKLVGKVPLGTIIEVPKDGNKEVVERHLTIDSKGKNRTSTYYRGRVEPLNPDKLED